MVFEFMGFIFHIIIVVVVCKHCRIPFPVITGKRNQSISEFFFQRYGASYFRIIVIFFIMSGYSVTTVLICLKFVYFN